MFRKKKCIDSLSTRELRNELKAREEWTSLTVVITSDGGNTISLTVSSDQVEDVLVDKATIRRWFEEGRTYRGEVSFE